MVGQDLWTSCCEVINYKINIVAAGVLFILELRELGATTKHRCHLVFVIRCLFPFILPPCLLCRAGCGSQEQRPFLAGGFSHDGTGAGAEEMARRQLSCSARIGKSLS